MLLLLVLAMLMAVLFATIFVLEAKDAWRNDILENIQIACALLGVLCFFVFVIFGVIGLLENSSWNCEVQLAELQAKRDAIIYQMNNGLYLGSSLEDFNAEIIKGRMCHDNPWFNVFAGEYYYKIDPIPVE